MLTLGTFPLTAKRDILLARQKARQIAALLHFEVHDQACIAAGAFAIATQALRTWGQAQLCAGIEDRTLHLFAQEGPDQTRAKPAAPPLYPSAAGETPAGRCRRPQFRRPGLAPGAAGQGNAFQPFRGGATSKPGNFSPFAHFACHPDPI